MPIEFHHLPILFFAALSIWAAICDLRRFVIPNRACLGIVALYPAYILLSPFPLDWAGALLVGAVVLAVGFGAFSLRLIGGGDAKLLAAGALWAGPDLLAPYIFITALAGGALALIAMAPWRALLPVVLINLGAEARVVRAAALPYGIAIATGGLFVAWRLLFAAGA